METNGPNDYAIDYLIHITVFEAMPILLLQSEKKYHNIKICCKVKPVISSTEKRIMHIV